MENKKKIILILAIAMLPFPVKGQFAYSSIDSYGVLKGTRELVRVDHTNTYFVTCQNTWHDCSRFIVDNGIDSKYFNTSVYLPNPDMSPTLPLNSGFIVNAMEIIGTTCWFAIGCFDVTDILNGTGRFQYKTISGTYAVNRIVAHTNGVAAIATTDMEESRVVELSKVGSNQWLYEVGRSNNAEEEFMDITNAGGKIVALSRFKDPQHIMYFKYNFGLRYEPIGLLASSQDQYIYDTYDAYSNVWTSFTDVSPIYINHTKRGNEVLISYIGKQTLDPNSPLIGQIIMYRIENIGGVVNEVLVSRDNISYSKLKEVRFNNIISEYTNLTLLAEDIQGNSAMKFPFLYKSGYYPDTVMYIGSPILESISPFQASNLGFDVVAAGRYASTQKNASIREYMIHDRMDYENQHNCFQQRIGLMHSRYSSLFKPIVKKYPLSSIFNSGVISPEEKTFQIYPIVKNRTCMNGNPM